MDGWAQMHYLISQYIPRCKKKKRKSVVGNLGMCAIHQHFWASLGNRLRVRAEASQRLMRSRSAHSSSQMIGGTQIQTWSCLKRWPELFTGSSACFYLFQTKMLIKRVLLKAFSRRKTCRGGFIGLDKSYVWREQRMYPDLQHDRMRCTGTVWSLHSSSGRVRRQTQYGTIFFPFFDIHVRLQYKPGHY